MDLKAQFSDIKEEVMEGISEVLESGEFVLGRALLEFEQEFSDFIFAQETKNPSTNIDIDEAIHSRIQHMYKQNYCVGVGNGCDALEIALRALELPQGSEVIIPANTYFACAEAVLNAGLKLAIVDCEDDGGFVPKTSMLSAESRAIIAVHLYGKVLELESFESFAKAHNLKLIEDCAQAHGGVDRHGRKVGSIGDVGCFSFYPAKNLGAYGDGGAIVSKDMALLHRARQIANHGQVYENSIPNPHWQKNNHIYIGRNSRLDCVQAKILHIKLKNLQYHNTYRVRCAREYNHFLEEFSFLRLPDAFAQSIWHLFVVECQHKAQGRRDEIMAFLKEHNIECAVHYPHALSDIEVLKNNPQVRIQSTPNASRRAANILSLPIGEHLSMEHVEYIASVIKELESRFHSLS
ncbi:DegT family aminotransferase [Helicobacter fennelliae]|uniref:DegT family aminotransferase n=1 Tax=Helicobacter fennelliae TaxID=215 RepID=A0A2X3DD63_9HELI|nr:DegT family aminotransferase [Helicobacter fennelliae]STQ83405.1 DegT family aminotransferase [Helicobacter fennelliae]